MFSSFAAKKKLMQMKSSFFFLKCKSRTAKNIILDLFSRLVICEQKKMC